VPGPLQYSPGIKAYVLNLLIAQMLSLRRVQQSIQALIGIVLSEATILTYVLQLLRVPEILTLLSALKSTEFSSVMGPQRRLS